MVERPFMLRLKYMAYEMYLTVFSVQQGAIQKKKRGFSLFVLYLAGVSSVIVLKGS